MKKPRKRRPSRSKYPNALPKGSYRLPDGGYVQPGNTVHAQHGKHRISVVAVRRENPDLRQLARLLVQMAREEAERKQQDLDTKV